ncbi:hypothetical protein FRD01_08590 [Microvenator marinus]|uniref:Uncharacterized protein n=1 Tax=Microvenator marinus TaxID=2600177 RepID=A0A5B8XV32_9DELT|nr:hypothetical protein [Microvenator marinus]QED27299.1 hypothetical protein FRD01_08590 [Microvenator marinus]
MKKMCTALVLGSLMIAGTAMAQEEPKSKFYDFDDMLIDGQLKTPDLMKAEAREKAQFKRLLSLKKSFIPKVRETAEEGALQ